MGCDSGYRFRKHNIAILTDGAGGGTKFEGVGKSPPGGGGFLGEPVSPKN